MDITYKRVVAAGAIYLALALADTALAGGSGMIFGWVFLVAFSACMIVSALVMTAFWIGLGLAFGLFVPWLFSGFLAAVTRKRWILLVLLPVSNVVVWFTSYSFFSMPLDIGISTIAIALGQTPPDVDVSDPLRPVGLFFTLVAVPVLALAGVGAALAVMSLGKLRSWRKGK